MKSIVLDIISNHRLGQNYEKHYVGSNITILLPYLENFLVTKTNPLIVVPEKSVGRFIHDSGNFERNRYGFRFLERKYYLYDKFVDVDIVNIMEHETPDFPIFAFERNDENTVDADDYILLMSC